MGILFPTEGELPNSSLAHYLAIAVQHFGAANSAYMLRGDGIDFAAVFGAGDFFDIASGLDNPGIPPDCSYWFMTVSRMADPILSPASSRRADLAPFAMSDSPCIPGIDAPWLIPLAASRDMPIPDPVFLSLDLLSVRLTPPTP